MVKVMQYVTISYDDEMLPFVKTDDRVWGRYEDAEHAANAILDLDCLCEHNPMNSDSKRMIQVGSEYYYDPNHPEETRREWTYVMGAVGVYYDEIFVIVIED